MSANAVVVQDYGHGTETNGLLPEPGREDEVAAPRLVEIDDEDAGEEAAASSGDTHPQDPSKTDDDPPLEKSADLESDGEAG